MPNRVIRESMLDSSRYLSVNPYARLLYMQLLLLADDFGCLSIEYPFIGRRCFDIRPPDGDLDELVNQLVDADLIRLYKYRNQRFAFVPRFRQRLKRETLKNPQPPDELLIDDLEAQDKFRRLNGHSYKGTTVGQPIGGPKSATGPLIEGTEAIKDSKTKDYVSKEVDGLGIGNESERNPAPAGDHRSPMDLAAEVAERAKNRLRKN